LALDGLFDYEGCRQQAPEVLYHYTNWTAAKGILCAQHFWETAHDCTNDDAELVSAHSVIVEVAETLRRTATGCAALALDSLLDSYQRLQVNKLKTIYLACFSLARDDQEQWRKYADYGRGLCLGVRVLNEPIPKSKYTGSALVQVDYSEESWRKNLLTEFGKICSLLSRADSSKHNVELGAWALYRDAAFASITAKQKKWAVEREFRHVTLIRAALHPAFRKFGGSQLPGNLVDLLSDMLTARQFQIPHGALDVRVSKPQLTRPQIDALRWSFLRLLSVLVVTKDSTPPPDFNSL
jgi:hypothetical protein